MDTIMGEGIPLLSEKELSIINYIKDGLSSSTIDMYRSGILKKLNLANNAALVNYTNKHLS